MQEIQTALLPFQQTRKTVVIPEGMTLQEMIEYLVPVDYAKLEFRILINSELIEKKYWRSVRPKQSAIVTINTVPGKGGGGKNPLATVISIAALIAAPYAAGAFGSSLALGIFGGGVATAGQVAFASGLIKVGIAGVAYLATSALSSTPAQSNNTRSANTSITESKTQYVEGASNEILPYGIIPANLGTNRMFPPQAALPYTETSGKKQYSRQMFTYGYGDVEITERKIGETLTSEFTEIEMEDKLSSDLNDGVDLYSNDVYQDGYAVTVSNSTGWITRTTQPNIDEFEIELTWSQFYGLSSEGDVQNITAAFEYRYAPTGTTDYVETVAVSYTERTTVSIRKVIRVVLPSNGQWDVDIRRTTADDSETKYRSEATLTAIRSITYVNPINQEDISGSAMRILGTDQLNGSVDKYNVICQTYMDDWDADGEEWLSNQLTSNPASIYRHILQSPAFAKAIPDERLRLDELQEWHEYCDTEGLTFNRVIDYETSVDELLDDVCAAGFATKSKVDGTYGVIVDNEKPVIKGMITPRNSWGYQAELIYPEIPHAYRVRFRNQDNGYALDERIVYADGYDEETAELYEVLEFYSCTDAELAYKYARRYLANLLLQPETHIINMDFENLTFNRGDRVTLVNDAILVGIGSARIKSLIYDDDETPTEVTGFVIDDVVEVPTNANNFAVRIRYADASSFAYHELDTVLGETNEFTFVTPITYDDDEDTGTDQMLEGALCSFVEDGLELDVLIHEITMNKDHSARIRAINYAPERFTAYDGDIPEFESRVTLPLANYRPAAPTLDGEVQSDESVMLKNSDASYVTRMVIPIKNTNEENIGTLVRIRASGTAEWLYPSALSVTPTEVVLTGLQGGSRYDIEIRYQRLTGQKLISQPLTLTNTLYEGATGIPSDVENFRVIKVGDSGFFEWDDIEDIDLSHYVIRHSASTSGASWGTSQVVSDRIKTNRVPVYLQNGTFLIKAVDILGNESENATSLVVEDVNFYRNVVETLDDANDNSWGGTKTNVVVDGSTITLDDNTSVGYYYFYDDPLDLSEIYDNNLTATVEAYGATVDGSGLNIRSVTSIREITSIRGVENNSFSVSLEMNYSDDDVTYSGWTSFVTGKLSARYLKFRLVLESFDPAINVVVSSAIVTVDMPDRDEAESELTVPTGGHTVTYSAAFQNNPAVNITVKDGEVDDKIEYTSKDATGFTFKVYNATVGDYVSRTFDYSATGYGRVVS